MLFIAIRANPVNEAVRNDTLKIPTSALVDKIPSIKVAFHVITKFMNVNQKSGIAVRINLRVSKCPVMSFNCGIDECHRKYPASNMNTEAPI